MRRVVAALLYLFPAQFRRSFGADMRTTFDDRWRERRGLPLAARTIFDLVANAFMQRFTYHPTTAQAGPTGDSAMSVLWQDFRFALRTLGKSPAFTVVAIASLSRSGQDCLGR
jgi:hypothetical protein